MFETIVEMVANKQYASAVESMDQLATQEPNMTKAIFIIKVGMALSNVISRSIIYDDPIAQLFAGYWLGVMYQQPAMVNMSLNSFVQALDVAAEQEGHVTESDKRADLKYRASMELVVDMARAFYTEESVPNLMGDMDDDTPSAFDDFINGLEI